jgi:hypothetical protein
MTIINMNLLTDTSSDTDAAAAQTTPNSSGENCGDAGDCTALWMTMTNAVLFSSDAPPDALSDAGDADALDAGN